MDIAVLPTFYQVAANGVPSYTALLARVPQYQSCEFTAHARYGFESASIQVVVSRDDALWWMDQLMSPVRIFSPWGSVVWEGFLLAVEAAFGNVQLSRSLDGMANRIDVRYATVLGTNGRAGVANTTSSQARYGVKSQVLDADAWDQTEAQYVRDRALAEAAWPRMIVNSTVQTGAADRQGALTLRCAGYYDTLSWLTTTRNDTTKESTTDQVIYLLGQVAATNAFISTSAVNITASGRTAVRTIEADTTYTSKIEALLALGNSSNQRLAWGVYEDRVFSVATWAGASPSTVHYRARLGGATLSSPEGLFIPWWDARPNRMLEVVDLFESAPVGAESAARYPIERTVCTVTPSGVSLALEPPQGTELDQLLISIGDIGRQII